MTATLDITDMMPGGHAPARSDEPRSIPATSDWADAVRALETAAAALAAISPADLPAHGLGEDLLRLNRTARVLESATAGAAHRFAHSDDWAADGARSPTPGSRAAATTPASPPACPSTVAASWSRSRPWPRPGDRAISAPSTSTSCGAYSASTPACSRP